MTPSTARSFVHSSHIGQRRKAGENGRPASISISMPRSGRSFGLQGRNAAQFRSSSGAPRRGDPQACGERHVLPATARYKVSCGGEPGRAAKSLFSESTDAGALFRFTDTYSRMVGGQMWIAMDPPTRRGCPNQDGLLDVRDFSSRGRPLLDGVVSASAPNGVNNNGVQFSRMRVEFTRCTGQNVDPRGVGLSGPTVGGTIEGIMDFAGNELRFRGTFVPLYGSIARSRKNSRCRFSARRQRRFDRQYDL